MEFHARGFCIGASRNGLIPEDSGEGTTRGVAGEGDISFWKIRLSLARESLGKASLLEFGCV